MPKTVAIGTQDFEFIRKNDCFYVDKTDFIREWWESKDAVTLITRPRRFGKTLNLNMVECFFSAEYANRQDLFVGLHIWEKEEYRRLQGTYPVISLSLASVKTNTFANARKQICELLNKLYQKHRFLLQGNVLSEPEKEKYNDINGNMDDATACYALHNLSDYLSRYYSRKVIILLDEYDAPLQEAYAGGYWNELIGFTRSLFNATFKTNPYLERALMTGITRVSKESVFSDLNNLEVITTTSSSYAGAFGFTECEVFEALDQQGLSSEKMRVREWYDGFVFGGQADIYNPWSVTNFIDKKKIDIYWADTSSNGLISNLIRRGHSDIKIAMEDLLAGNELCVEIDEQIIFEQLDQNINAIWSLFLASGYLRIVRAPIDAADPNQSYLLRLTNQEVHVMFQRMIDGWFKNYTPDYNDFIKALLHNDIKAMNHYMNKVALATFSFFDSGNRPSRYTEPERFYHGFVLGLIVDLRDRYVITSNRESGFGRYDVILEPRKDTELDAIILEFKVYDPGEETDLSETLTAALSQIDQKEYAADLIAKGMPESRIRKYGFAFEGKRVLIGQGHD